MKEYVIELPEHLAKAVKEVAKNRGVTPEEYIQEVLEAMLK